VLLKPQLAQVFFITATLPCLNVYQLKQSMFLCLVPLGRLFVLSSRLSLCLQAMMGDLTKAVPGIDEAMSFAELMKQV